MSAVSLRLRGDVGEKLCFHEFKGDRHAKHE